MYLERNEKGCGSLYISRDFTPDHKNDLPTHVLSSQSYSSQTSNMPPIPTGVSRLVLYHQTIHDKSGNHVPIRPLAETGVTHLYIAAIHLNDRPEDITLNDHHPDDPRYKQLWEEVEYLQGQKVMVMGMLGGAAKGSYERLQRDVSQQYVFARSH